MAINSLTAALRADPSNDSIRTLQWNRARNLMHEPFPKLIDEAIRFVACNLVCVFLCVCAYYIC